MLTTIINILLISESSKDVLCYIFAGAVGSAYVLSFQQRSSSSNVVFGFKWFSTVSPLG